MHTILITLLWQKCKQPASGSFILLTCFADSNVLVNSGRHKKRGFRFLNQFQNTLMVSKQTERYSWSYDCHELFLSSIYSLFSTYICSFMICEFGIIRKLHKKVFRIRPMKSTKQYSISGCPVCSFYSTTVIILSPSQFALFFFEIHYSMQGIHLSWGFFP